MRGAAQADLPKQPLAMEDQHKVVVALRHGDRRYGPLTEISDTHTLRNHSILASRGNQARCSEGLTGTSHQLVQAEMQRYLSTFTVSGEQHGLDVFCSFVLGPLLSEINPSTTNSAAASKAVIWTKQSRKSEPPPFQHLAAYSKVYHDCHTLPESIKPRPERRSQSNQGPKAFNGSSRQRN